MCCWKVDTNNEFHKIYDWKWIWGKKLVLGNGTKHGLILST